MIDSKSEGYISMAAAATRLSEECAEACKGDPFKSPTLVFADAKTEQWFKKFHLSRCGVFANIRFERLGSFIEGFLRKSLGNNSPEPESSVILGHRLFAILRGLLDYKDFDAVRRYSSDGTGGISEGKLFDLSQRLSTLFIDYQELDCPIDEIFKDSTHADWEKNLYEKMFPGHATVRSLFDECKETSKKFDMGAPAWYFGPENQLTPLQNSILEYAGCEKVLFSRREAPVDEGPEVKAVSAPSKLREVEVLHSEVCSLIQEEEKLSDMLVLIPDVDSYRTAIHQVFDIPKGSSTVHVPYSIVEPDASATFTVNLLEALFKIAAKKDFSRRDFFEIVDNPVVRASRGITASDVEAFKSWVSEMNVYRDGEEVVKNGKEIAKKRDDWVKAIKRMILARFTTNSVDGISPFEDLASKSDETLGKFIGCIDDLQYWVELTGKGSLAADEPEDLNGKLEELKDFLRGWIQVDPRIGGLDGERISYAGALGSFKGLLAEVDEGAKSISFEVIGKTVLSGAMAADYSPSELFVGGLSIARFLDSRIISAKYTFMLGMDSKTMPGTDVRDSLDLRPKGSVIPHTALNRSAFFTTIANTSGTAYISFVNRDLAKDEEFFASPLLEEMGVKPEVIGIDETRSWDELFTSRSFRNKEKSGQIFKNSVPDGITAEKLKTMLSSLDRPRVVGLGSLRDFLKEPFQMQVGRLLPKEEDDSIGEEFEPLDFDSLQQWAILHEMVAEKKTAEEFKKEHEKDIALPEGYFTNQALEVLEEARKNITAAMSQDNTEIVMGETCQLSLNVPDGSGNMIPFEVRGQLSWRNPDGSIFMDVSAGKTSDKDDKFLKMYVSALAFWADKPDYGEKEITLKMYYADGKMKSREFKITDKGSDGVESAADILSRIIRKAYIDNDSLALPINFVNEDISYEDYCKKFSNINGSPWSYFPYKDIFDIKEVCGFTEGDFTPEIDSNSRWTEARKEVVSMVKYLEEVPDDKKEENEDE